MKNTSRWLLAAAVCASSTWAFNTVRADEDPAVDTEHAAYMARFTLGGEFRQSEFEGFGDVLIPLVATETGLIFLNPRASFTDRSEEEYNIGLGYRHLFAERNLILGGNVFYDYRDTRFGSTYHQLGLGLEMLSEWVDARVNYYRPERKRFLINTVETETVQQSTRTVTSWSEIFATGNDIKQNETIRNITTTTTTRQTFEQYEQALEGFDAEIGVKLPIQCPADTMEARVFAGYYYFDGRLSDDVKGAKARLEIRAMPTLFFDAGWYENKDLTGSDFYVGARVNVPLDLHNLARGRNPFASDDAEAGARPFAHRMTEMVMRDLHVRYEVSDLTENEELREVSTTSRNNRRVRGHELVEDVAFVDGDQTGPGDGTAENPFPTIQDGVNSAHQNVYVYAMQGGAGEYHENVEVTSTKNIIGQGHTIFGFAGHTYGGDARPVVNGRLQGPAMVLHGAHDSTVAGMHFVNTFAGLAPSGSLTDPAFSMVGFRSAGLYVRDSDNVTVFGNTFSTTSRGLWFAARGNNLSDFSANVIGNTFIANGEGLLVRAGGTGLTGGALDTVSLNLIGNEFAWNVTGAEIEFGVSGTLNIFGEDNIFRNNVTGLLMSRVLLTPTPTYNIDFGGGALGSAGGNAVFNNVTGFRATRISANSITVENNYWGGSAPTTSLLLPSDLRGYPFTNPFINPGANWLENQP